MRKTRKKRLELDCDFEDDDCALEALDTFHNRLNSSQYKHNDTTYIISKHIVWHVFISSGSD